MPSCDRIRRQLSLYAVGGLSGRARVRIHRHLDSCGACRAELAALERTGELLSNARPDSAPAAGWESVKQEVLARPRLAVKSRLRRTWRLALALVALVVLVVGVDFVRPYRPSAPPLVVTAEVREGDDDTPAAMETHLSAQWSTPLADEAAMGLRMAEFESRQ
jgi:anti-sigma factor RsiW